MATLSFEPLSYDDIPESRRPSRLQATVPSVGMLLFLSVGVIYLDMEPHMPLVWGIGLTGLVGRYWIGVPWEEQYEGIVDGLRMGMQAILILFVVYMLIAAWIGAGTIPTLIYYGLELLEPSFFLPLTAILAFGVAFTVGSSWTTAGTLGVAFMGIGTGLGVPGPMTAGAILTGAYTGDKVSPLSDTTNLAAAVTNTDLMRHVHAMRVGTLLAFAIGLAGYAFLGLRADGAIPADELAGMQAAIAGAYQVTPATVALASLLPLLVTFAFAFRGNPALPSLSVGVFAGVATAVLLQGRSFAGAWAIAKDGTDPATGSEAVNELLAAGGLMGSIWVVSLVVAALALGGLLERTGVLAAFARGLEEGIERLVDATASLGRDGLTHRVRIGGLTVGTGASAFSMNVLAAEQYMSIVVPGLTLRNLYDDYGLESRNLSRAIEAAGTTTSALVPWSTGGIFMAGVLGVPTLEYAPYYFLGLLSPLILALMGLSGWQMYYLDGGAGGDDSQAEREVAADVATTDD
ncbi:MAG: Na+/H+ antiporter NhaC family protein [Haloferacaceae archaeon]